MENFFRYRYKAHWVFALQVFFGKESSRDFAGYRMSHQDNHLKFRYGIDAIHIGSRKRDTSFLDLAIGFNKTPTHFDFSFVLTLFGMIIRKTLNYFPFFHITKTNIKE